MRGKKNSNLKGHSFMCVVKTLGIIIKKWIAGVAD